MLEQTEEASTVNRCNDYPRKLDADGITPNDPDHTDDVIRRVQGILDLIWKDRAGAVEKEACKILGVKDLREYFRKPSKGGFWTAGGTIYRSRGCHCQGRRIYDRGALRAGRVPKSPRCGRTAHALQPAGRRPDLGTLVLEDAWRSALMIPVDETTRRQTSKRNAGSRDCFGARNVSDKQACVRTALDHSCKCAHAHLQIRSFEYWSDRATSCQPA